MPGDLLTDLYELNIAASYLRRGMTGTATFSLFARRLPPDRGFLIAAGLEHCLAFLVARGARRRLRRRHQDGGVRLRALPGQRLQARRLRWPAGWPAHPAD
jgi:nicotinic acid phosphoribosyltransferase